ncbi:MAG: 50S ribosomal protein L2 [Pelagibacteraceae bacterium]|nr:50S ribosomal protein L2 [Pelagibacteraceae bacterium]PPR51767.1 MAG: 50S ribosomal protein L2 [Alphaproteobacteria bacterium MarineAlpha5_Bin10]|tara:strand:- start:533 stop:1354 length:822 start_codon:yes stop_codon:yes gene_type:complete
MALKFLKPSTTSQRGTVLIDRRELWKGKPYKPLVKGLKSSSGRNNQGKITSRRMGSGVKRNFRTIDFKRNKFDIVGKIERIEYDPYRSAFIALVKYNDGEFRYIIAPQNISAGNEIISAEKAEIKIGNCLPLKNIPLGTNIHNIEMKKGKGGQLARSAGTYAQISSKSVFDVQVKLASGEVRLVNADCLATIGTVSNPDNKNIKLGKAGRKRHLGYRPKVRGVVMNPVDHPHGGGEGRTSGGRHPVSPTGVPTKGKKTRKNKKTNKMIIKRRK